MIITKTTQQSLEKTDAHIKPNTIVHGDCLKCMRYIPSHSVDMVLVDLPYGVSDCKWDCVIDVDDLWSLYQQKIKKHTALVFFGTEPFLSNMRTKYQHFFRYDLIWDKGTVTGIFNVHKMPLRRHENIDVYYQHLPVYNPQKLYKVQTRKKRVHKVHTKDQVYDRPLRWCNESDGKGYPQSILYFNNAQGEQNSKHRYHPTQKPVSLLSYLIRTYTNEGDTVLDNTAGSGSTGVAAIETGRKFIGIEQDKKYFDIMHTRLKNAQPPLPNV